MEGCYLNLDIVTFRTDISNFRALMIEDLCELKCDLCVEFYKISCYARLECEPFSFFFFVNVYPHTVYNEASSACDDDKKENV